MELNCTDCEFSSCALETLSMPELSNLESKTYQTSFSRGETIRKQNTPVNTLIYLRSGYIKEYIRHDFSDDQVIQIISPRAYIGLMGICTNTRSLYSYEAITNVEVCFIDKEMFSDLVSGNGRFAKEILIALSKETENNNQRFLKLNKSQTFGRVASLLLYLSEQVYRENEFELWLSRTEMAQMIASTRESVTRALRWFHHEKIIEMNRNHISIIDLERLTGISVKG